MFHPHPTLCDVFSHRYVTPKSYFIQGKKGHSLVKMHTRPFSSSCYFFARVGRSGGRLAFMLARLRWLFLAAIAGKPTDHRPGLPVEQQ